MNSFHKTLLVLLVIAATVATAEEPDRFEEIRELRWAGELNEALDLTDETLNEVTDPFDKVRAHLEAARTHDRIGLHFNTRPVAAVLEHIDAAALAAEPGHELSEAMIAMARAAYFYRAEMAEREFPITEQHTLRAIEIFDRLEDRRNQADAVHRLGLVELQRRNLDRAHELFDESLRLDREGGERIFFRGEYGRHVGFVYLLKGDNEAAIPYFERSLEARKQAGAIDASLFAASQLGSSLVTAGRLDEAGPILKYGMTVARKIDSPVGKARIGLVQGRLHAQAGDSDAARAVLERTIEIAESVSYSSVAEQAREELEKL